MGLTLNIGGLFIEGNYSLDKDGSIAFSDCKLTWIDDGDLHKEKATGLKAFITPIEDFKFIFAEQILKAQGYTPGKYPIKIHWQMSKEEIDYVLPPSEHKLKKKIKIIPTPKPPKDKSGFLRCGVPCKDFERYGLCDRLVSDEFKSCYQHA